MSEHVTPHVHHEGGHHAPARGPDLTEAEWHELRDDDVQAGTVVVCLMASIFTIGLLLYITIAVSVS